MNSKNHQSALAAFREPLPPGHANPSSDSWFLGYIFISKIGFRTRYPLAAATTACCAHRESSQPWQAGIYEDLGGPVRRISQNWYHLGSLTTIKRMAFSSFSREKHIGLPEAEASRADQQKATDLPGKDMLMQRQPFSSKKSPIEARP